MMRILLLFITMFLATLTSIQVQAQQAAIFAPVFLLLLNNNTSTAISEKQAARFLAQSTFGPTSSEIQKLIRLNDYGNWIDMQAGLPASFHLAEVIANSSDGEDGQSDRYLVFWDRALYANDQLRQRVALALSEIMVVSDRPDALTNHANLLAAYYDILLSHAFGNYRDLLEAVTLSPAMGIYLSMLGNETSQNRADENYAREVMQLFSIGLVKLHRDGRPVLGNDGKPIPTYSQNDIANLAKVFTGWTWNKSEYNPGPIDGWWPDKHLMEIPMKAFADHHDTVSKTFLGVTLPAAQTPEKDMADAMDTLFNHPNVGPFIGRQLIQRLVTSNPSRGYISRVAAVFNDNGHGVRGDLKSVIKTILLDPEARSDAIAQSPNGGKLREPVLRFSHLWRAFRVQDPIEMLDWRGFMPQHAALTAKSVFNFYSPGYSPPGPISDSGLVAPEFQVDSEAWIGAMYNLLITVVQTDSFYGHFPTTLNLETELGLLDRPEQLLDHLDLLLMSGSMSNGFKQILLSYISQSQQTLTEERIVRDVITLVITSAEYSVQR